MNIDLHLQTEHSRHWIMALNSHSFGGTSIHSPCGLSDKSLAICSIVKSLWVLISYKYSMISLFVIVYSFLPHYIISGATWGQNARKRTFNARVCFQRVESVSLEIPTRWRSRVCTLIPPCYHHICFRFPDALPRQPLKFRLQRFFHSPKVAE